VYKFALVSTRVKASNKYSLFECLLLSNGKANNKR
jgi:hypothetical protein